MKNNYMMNADDIMKELGVGRSKAYKIIKELNVELEKSGYTVLSGKIPRPFVERKFYGYEVNVS